VARFFAADRLVFVQGVNAGKLFLGVDLGRPVLDLLVLGAGFAGEVAVGAKAPGVGAGKLVARFIIEVNMIDLLDGPAGKACVMLDEVFEIGAGRNLGITVNGLIPGEVAAGKHRVYAWEPADIATDNAATGEEKRREGNDVPVTRGLAVGRITPERVIIADAMGVVPNVVTGGFVAPRLERVLDALTNALPECIQGLVGDADKLAAYRLCHACSFCVLFVYSASRRGLECWVLLAQGSAVDLPRRGLGQCVEKLDLPWVFMLAELRLHKCLKVRRRLRRRVS